MSERHSLQQSESVADISSSDAWKPKKKLGMSAMGSFNQQLYNIAMMGNSMDMSVRAMHSSAERLSTEKSLATFFGPTCDSMDCIAKDVPMEELQVGEWVAFSQMGAYTNAAASTFNGMPRAMIHYCQSETSSPDLNN